METRENMNAKSPSDPDIAVTLDLGRVSHRRRRLVRGLILLTILVAVAAVVVVRRGGDKSPAAQYETQEAQRGNLVVLVTATGTLQPTNKVDVGSEISGIVKTVEANYNDKVKAGQVLARIDTSKLEAQATQSRAALEAAKARVLQAQATVSETSSKLAQYQRVRELSNGKVPSQAEFDAAQAAAERAKADAAGATAAVDQAQATVEANQTDIAKAVIHSPIDGIVLTRSVEPGQTVAAAFQTPVLFTIAEDLTQMELHVDVDEADVGQIKEGQDATFTVDAYLNRTFNARITQTRCGSKTVNGVVTYETVLKVDNADLCLRPGMTATADIMVKKVQDAVLVPSAALRFTPPVRAEKAAPRGLLGAMLPRPPMPQAKPQEKAANGKQQVWTLKEGQPTVVPVTIGATNGIMAEVLEGDVKPGTVLVTDVATARK
jgi:HlyD family secretion protein